MSSLKSFSILYAGDDKLIRQGYVKYLETIFENVYEAADGKEAYSLYKQQKPDILLLDVNMPYIDGLKLVEKIREDDQEVKIIILTAHVQEEKLLQAIPLNLISYLKKPVKKKELKQVILSLISALELKNRDSSIIKLSQTITWDINGNNLLDNGQKIHLTRNEIVLLNILSSKSKVHYSIDDISEEFYQLLPHKNMSQDSIKNIIKRLKQKLPQDCIQNHYGIGYKLSLSK